MACPAAARVSGAAPAAVWTPRSRSFGSTIRDRPAGELSQGQRQLVSIGRAMVGRPELVLLDEPAAGLDSTESQWLGDRLCSVRDTGVTILMVDHDVNLVLGLCDYILVLDFGQLIASGTPGEIRTDRNVIEAYLGSTHFRPRPNRPPDLESRSAIGGCAPAPHRRSQRSPALTGPTVMIVSFYRPTWKPPRGRCCVARSERRRQDHAADDAGRAAAVDERRRAARRQADGLGPAIRVARRESCWCPTTGRVSGLTVARTSRSPGCRGKGIIDDVVEMFPALVSG